MFVKVRKKPSLSFSILNNYSIFVQDLHKKNLVDRDKFIRYDQAYLRMAKQWGELSYCQRKKVGALIVKDRMIISDGYNGTPSGFENCCEDESGVTKWYVLHAEANAILKVAKSTQSCKGATLYITMSPCKNCSKLIHQAGIVRVVFLEHYKDVEGIEFLKKAGVVVEQMTLNP